MNSGASPKSSRLRRVSRDACVNVALAALSTLFFLICAEWISRATGKFSLELKIPKEYEQFNFEEPYTVKSEVPGLLYELIRGQYANNSRGFRGPEFAVPKPEGAFRIVMLGDSVTNGYHAGPVFHSFPHLLGEKFKELKMPVEVINEGIPGYNLEQEFIHFKTYGLATQPDLVVLGISIINDYEEKLVPSEKPERFVRQIIVTPRVFSRVAILPEAMEGWLIQNSHFYRFLSNRIAGLLGDETDVYHVGKEKNLKALSELNALLKSRGIPLYALIFPPTMWKAADYPKGMKVRHLGLREFLRNEGIPFRDYLFLISDHDLDRIRADNYCHFNLEGNRIIADEIFKDLRF